MADDERPDELGDEFDEISQAENPENGTFYGRSDVTEAPQVARIDRDVWFFLIEARVSGGDSRSLRAGSLTLVQCFVPGHRLEDCLAKLDAYLPGEHLSRIDTLRAIRYDANAEDEDYPGEFFRKPLEKAASRNQCILGIFVTSDEVRSTGGDVH